MSNEKLRDGGLWLRVCPLSRLCDRKDAVIQQWPDVVKTHVRQPKTALQKSVRKEVFLACGRQHPQGRCPLGELLAQPADLQQHLAGMVNQLARGTKDLEPQPLRTRPQPRFR
jgi:hypothetical protein